MKDTSRASRPTAGSQSIAFWSCMIGVMVATILCYFEMPGADFVQYDDQTFIVGNPTLRTLTPLGKFLFDKKSYSNDGRFTIYRPLPAFSYAVDYQISFALDRSKGLPPTQWRPNPTVFHLTSILGHAVNAALVFVLLWLLFGNLPAATLGALIFGVHPLNTEAVSWVSRRGNVLFLMFALVALCCHVRLRSALRHRGALYAGVLAGYGLSLLSQELAIVLPVLLLAYDLLLVRKERRKLSDLAVYYVLMGILAVGYLLLRHEVLGRTAQQGYHGGSFWTTVFTMSKVFVTYLRQLFVPVRLAVTYGVPLNTSLIEPVVLGAIAFLTALVASAIVLYKRLPLYSFCVAWFFITLGPVSNLIPLQALQNDRFLYMTTVGLSIGLAGLLAWSMNRPEKKTINPLSGALVLLLSAMVIVGGVMSFVRNRAWQSTFELWRTNVEVEPDSHMARSNLGTAYLRKGDLDEAIAQWKAALPLLDKPYLVACNLANVYMEVGRHEDAEKMARQAVSWRPDQFRSHFTLGDVLNALKRDKEAEAAYRQALMTQVRVPTEKYIAHMQLARILMRGPRDRKRLAEALLHAETACNLFGAPEVGTTYVEALRLNGRIKDATKAAQYFYKLAGPGTRERMSLENQLRQMGVKPQP